jgi:desampylase
MELRISRQHLEQLHFWAEKAHPKEVCGLLWGIGMNVETVEESRNVALDPLCEFEIDPAALLKASRLAREQKLQVIGYFHSHPNGCAEPSITDAQMAAGDGRFWLIVANGSVTAWRAGASGSHLGRFTPVNITKGDA